MKSRLISGLSGIVLLICLFGFEVQAQNTSLPVGVVPGSADVTAMGAATYNIPIEVVPGTHGVQPNLNVVYNSMIGTGILGSQWDLSGISAITRVGQNTFLDQRSTSVSMLYFDRFELDGNRLVCSDPTYYGSSGTRYQPEFEDFSKIYSYGTVGFGPEYFIVYHDDGSVAEYGNTADSKQRLGNGIYSWYVNKITDINGNYMTFTYGYSGSEIWIDHIDYTGNTVAGLSPYARVSFAYDTYAQVGSTFVAGYEIPQTRLLRTITVQYKNGTDYELVRQYLFSYTEEYPKRLTEIGLMGSDQSILNSTEVTWNGSTNHDEIATTVLPLQYQAIEKQHVAVDFNQDGACDLFVHDIRSWYYFQNQNGQFIYSNDNYNANYTWYIQDCVPADVDGDGFSELITVFSDYPKHTVYVTKTQFPFQTDTIIPTLLTDEYKGVVTGDFLGNGRNQVVLTYKEAGSYYIISPSLNITQPVVGGAPEVLDFDGDGQMELMLVDEPSGTDFTIYKYDAALNIFNEVKHGTFSDIFRASGDFNGDGITDVLVGQSTSFHVMLGTGKGFVNKPATHDFGHHNTLPLYQIKPVVVDINNDGFDDVLAFKKIASGLTVICYVGCGYYNDTLHFQDNIPPSTYPIILDNSEIGRFDFTFGDFNDDHHLDLISFKIIDALNEGVLVCEFKMDKRIPQVKKVTAGDGSFAEWIYHDIFGLHYRYATHISILPYQYNVVEAMTNSLGTVTQTNQHRYSFEHPAYSFKRRQRMGFLNTSVTDVNTNTTDSLFCGIIRGENNNLIQDIIMPERQKTYVYGQLFKSVGYQPVCLTFDNNQRRYPFVCQTNDTNHLDMTVTRTLELRFPFGRKTSDQQTVKSANDFYPQFTVQTDYYHTTHQFPSGGAITTTDSIIQTSKMNNSSIQSVRKQYFTYNSRYLPEQIRVLMDGVSSSQTIQSYDHYGNGTLTTYSGDSCLNKTITNLYDNTGRFCTYESLGSSFSFYRTFSPTTGSLLSIMDENNLTTSYHYDAFGRLTKVIYPDNNTDSIQYRWYTDSEIPYAKYYTVTRSSGHSFAVEKYYDLMGRNICSWNNGYFSDTCYDIKGQVYRISEPYQRGTADANKIWHFYQYDQYGRIVNESGPYTDISYQYSGYTTTITDNLRQTTSTRTKDAVGCIRTATDVGGTISYNYSHVSYNDKTATQTNITACGHTTTIYSDGAGNRLRIVDPNAGTVTTSYNAQDQPLQQTDARGNITRWQYDEWGRMTKKVFTNPSSDSVVLTYEYDSYSPANRGRGKVSCVKINGVSAEHFSYDQYSRLAQHTRTIDGTDYTESYSYNTYGQLASLIYPDGFATDFTYTGKGYLSEITRHDNNKNVFKAYTYNIYGQPTKCGYGNSTATEYDYNPVGLLTRIKTGWKNYGLTPHPHDTIIFSSHLADINGMNEVNGLTDLINPAEQPFTVDSTIQSFRYSYDNKGRLTKRMQMGNRYETFQYDNLDRLTSFTQVKVNGPSQSFTTVYDLQGNIQSNTLAGTYSYDSGKPHAVTRVTPNDTFPNSISTEDCETDYNVFNQPSRIAEGDVEILLEYGADNQRVKAVFKRSGQVERTRYYINANYEKEVDANGVTTHYNYIYGATGLAAICVRRNGVDSMYYVHPDRLGSYTHITDKSRQVIRALHFDPWGNVKADTNWTVFEDREPGELANTFRFDRGFTGHEHYADLKIINMNGRLYDPVIARFFSPDNFVQAPEFTQSHNRYSYCLNNPLQWVDPSGEFSFNDWYIDSKRNLQWFESTSEYLEVNGETYSRVGRVVVGFSKNGQRIYGDEYGGLHYLYSLEEVVIGKAKQQEAISSSEIEIGLSYPQKIVTTSSELLSIGGTILKQSNSTFQFTISEKGICFNYNNNNGCVQNLHVKTRSVSQIGKTMNTAGNIMGTIDALYSIYKISQSESTFERIKYSSDGTMDIVGMFGPLGVWLSLHYNIQIKHYPEMQKEVRRQHYDRNDMIKKGYIPVGYPGMPFR